MTELRHLQARNSKLENFDIDVYSNLNNAFQYENSIIMIANNNKNYSLRTYIFPYSLEKGELRTVVVNPITNRKEGLKWTGQTKKARGLTQKSERTRMGTTNLHTLSLQSPHSAVQTSCLLEEHKCLNAWGIWNWYIFKVRNEPSFSSSPICKRKGSEICSRLGMATWR